MILQFLILQNLQNQEFAVLDFKGNQSGVQSNTSLGLKKKESELFFIKFKAVLNRILW